MNCFQTLPPSQSLELKLRFSEVEYCFSVQSLQIREEKNSGSLTLTKIFIK